MGDVLIQMEDIDKQFPGVQALKDCRFELRRARYMRWSARMGLASQL